jgi:hypothetical protein
MTSKTISTNPVLYVLPPELKYPTKEQVQKEMNDSIPTGNRNYKLSQYLAKYANTYDANENKYAAAAYRRAAILVARYPHRLIVPTTTYHTLIAAGLPSDGTTTQNAFEWIIEQNIQHIAFPPQWRNCMNDDDLRIHFALDIIELLCQNSPITHDTKLSILHKYNESDSAAAAADIDIARLYYSSLGLRILPIIHDHINNYQ